MCLNKPTFVVKFNNPLNESFNPSKSKTVIIVAGGTGKRMQADIPKQFIELKSKPILMHTIEVFVKYNHHINIIVVLPENQMVVWKQMCESITLTLSIKRLPEAQLVSIR